MGPGAVHWSGGRSCDSHFSLFAPVIVPPLGTPDPFYHEPYGSGWMGPESVTITHGSVTSTAVRETQLTIPTRRSSSTRASTGEAALGAARFSFAAGDPASALEAIDLVVVERGGSDLSLQQFRALALFALGRYDEAAAVVGSVLASGPVWDWATLIGHYQTPTAYTEQLRRLEARVDSGTAGRGIRSLLGYHYLVAGHQAEAEFLLAQRENPVAAPQSIPGRAASVAPSVPQREESNVSEKAPPVVDHSLASSEEQENRKNQETAPSAPAVVPEIPETERSVPDPVGNSPRIETDPLVARWKTVSTGGEPIVLDLAPDGSFLWKHGKGGNATALEGKWRIEEETRLILDTGAIEMIATIEVDDSSMRFVLVDGAEDDDGLLFDRE